MGGVCKTVRMNDYNLQEWRVFGCWGWKKGISKEAFIICGVRGEQYNMSCPMQLFNPHVSLNAHALFIVRGIIFFSWKNKP